MAMFIDARIPVRLHTAPGPRPAVEPANGIAWVIEEDGAPGAAAEERFALAGTPHPPACACCSPRGPAAEAFSRLFLRRARGDLTFAAVSV